MKPRVTAFALLALAALGGGCQLVPPEEDPTHLKQVELDNRLTRVERVVDNQGLMNLMSQIDSLQKETRALRNDVETLRNSVEQGGERQRQLYLDLDQRLQALEKRGAVAAPAAAASGAAATVTTPAGDDRASYQAAFDLLKQGRYEQGTQAFRQFLASYPQSSLADNGQYWLAESLYVAQKYKEALPEFEAVLSKYPQSRKTPDALLKVGYCNYELKRYDAARKALTSVVQGYGDTTAARLASQRLQTMAGEGH